MTFELYTVPRCDECDEVKAFLDSQGIEYNVFNLREHDDKKVFGRVYPQISDHLQKNVQNQTILPLLVEKNDRDGVERFAQRSLDIKALFG